MNAVHDTEPATPWHALEAAAALEQLGSDAAAGVSCAVAQQRAAQSGPNALPEPPRRSRFVVFLRQFKSPLIYILFVAAALALAMGHWSDAAVILAVVLVNAIVGAYQEGRAERSMTALRRLAALQVRVLRDGREPGAGREGRQVPQRSGGRGAGGGAEGVNRGAKSRVDEGRERGRGSW